MLEPRFFTESLLKHGTDFYAGVPDSLLKSLCAWLSDTCAPEKHIITANEGAAVALAAGHFLATGRPGCVYMQNSGEGNAINPLASLTDADVYNIPVLLLIGWRGCPGIHDEPQHVKQGKVTLPLLEAMGIPYSILSADAAEASAQIDTAFHVLSSGQTYALVVRKDTFALSGRPSVIADSDRQSLLTREEAIQIVAGATGPSDVIVSSTGMISRELFEYRESSGEGHGRDFLTVGSMGHASQIALGISLEQPQRRVWCFDGDGAVIMHMGSLAITASKAGVNFIHVVFNNGAHDSVGGQPTVGFQIDLAGVARACGYKQVYSVSTKDELVNVFSHLDGPVFIEVKVRKGNRPDLGRPTTTPIQNRDALMSFLKK
ncbi:MAG: phosphonopyruvate decarboxylase [Bacteroidales bacterium]|nr:phosphonopyruvate decarboxylase [Bacteroidales bacterium]